MSETRKEAIVGWGMSILALIAAALLSAAVTHRAENGRCVHFDAYPAAHAAPAR